MFCRDILIDLNYDKFYCIGHRGNELFDPENSLTAFKRVAEIGIDFIETDIQISKDNHFILFHDRFLDKKTNFKGQVKKYTLEKLRTAKYTYFDKKTEKLCALEELLDYISKMPEPKTRLILELKSKFNKIHFVKLISLIDQYNSRDYIIISSFYEKNLKNLRKISKDIFCTLLLKKTPKIKITHHGLKYFGKIYRMIKIFDIQAVSIHRDDISASIIEYFKNKRLFVFAWGINDIKDYRNIGFIHGLNGFTAPDPITQKKIRQDLLNY